MPKQDLKRLFSTGELLTLGGMGLAVLSAALTWGVSAPEVPTHTEVAAYFVTSLTRHRAGFDMKLGALSIGWIVVICAVACACMLLTEPKRETKGVMLAAQIVLGVVIIGVAAMHLGPYPGPMLALAGGAALILGGIARYK